MVRVGDSVEVRDRGGAWAAGVVEAVSGESGLPTVAKQGWDMGYEWEECRLKVIAQAVSPHMGAICPVGTRHALVCRHARGPHP